MKHATAVMSKAEAPIRSISRNWPHSKSVYMFTFNIRPQNVTMFMVQEQGQEAVGLVP